jgi:hypothetical protein
VLKLRAGAVVLKTIRIVALVAGSLKPGLLKGPVVGIGVTALAAAGIQPFELSSLLTGLGSVALLASHGLMQSGQREVCFRMAESGGRLEAVLVVALGAIGSELALMLIFVTASALTAKTEKRPVGIFKLDLGPGGGGNPGRGMTLLAFLLAMLAGQGEACLGEVVELLAVQENKRHFLPVMFLVTALAIRFASRAFVRAPVKPGLSFHSSPDLGVTLQTLESARGRSNIVTGGTFSHALQLLVRGRQRAGSELRRRQRAKRQRQRNSEQPNLRAE